MWLLNAGQSKSTCQKGRLCILEMHEQVLRNCCITWGTSAEDVRDGVFKACYCDTKSVNKSANHVWNQRRNVVLVKYWNQLEVVEKCGVWIVMASFFMMGDRRLTIVFAMASVGSGRLCARVQKKLCQWGQFRCVSATATKRFGETTPKRIFNEHKVCSNLDVKKPFKIKNNTNYIKTNIWT